MPKTKRGPALFELLDLEREEVEEKLKVPSWWSENSRLAKAETADAQTPSVISGPKGGETNAEEKAAARGGGSPVVPLVEYDGTYLRLSVTSLTGALVVFLGLLLVGAMFGIGHRRGFQSGRSVGFAQGRASYEADTASEIETARRQPPATHLVRSLLEVPADDTPAQPVGDVPAEGESIRNEPPRGEVPWIRDYTYIVVQEFSAVHADDAIDARAYLAGQGVDTTEVALATGGVQLITNRGYNHRDRTQREMAEELLRKVHALGEKYYTLGGGYKLKGYFKTLKSETW